jgi:hypothetical protein
MWPGVVHCCVVSSFDSTICMLCIWNLLFMLVSIVDNLHFCICCLLHIVVDHLSFYIFPLIMSVVIVIHITGVISGEHITDCIYTIRMRYYHVLMGLLHHMMRFRSLGVKFLKH